MDKVTLYSTHCPKCKVIEKKLGSLGIEYELIDDIDEIIKFGENAKIRQAPILVVDDEIYDFVAANNLLNSKTN